MQRGDRYRGQVGAPSQRPGGILQPPLELGQADERPVPVAQAGLCSPVRVIVESRSGLGAEVATLHPLAEDPRSGLLAAELRRQVVDHAAPDVEPSQVDHLHRPQERPADAGPLGQDRVDVLGRGHAGLEEVQGLPHQGRLQAVGHESRDVPAEEHGALADGDQDRQHLLDPPRRHGGMRHHLDEGNELRRVEVVGDRHPLRVNGRTPGEAGDGEWWKCWRRRGYPGRRRARHGRRGRASRTRISGMHSVTSAAPPRAPSRSVVGRIRASAADAAEAPSTPSSTSRRRLRSISRSAPSSLAASTSWSRTAAPAVAKSCAIPCPMTPAPTTATGSISASPARRRHGPRLVGVTAPPPPSPAPR